MSSFISSASNHDPEHEVPLCQIGADSNGQSSGEPNLSLEANLRLEPWRSEVAARLARYRARRKPRLPRYPSLRLPFEPVENWSTAVAGSTAAATLNSPVSQESATPRGEAVAGAEIRTPALRPATKPQAGLAVEPELSAKIIEFPRSAAIPLFQPSPLADPIFDRPRIVEAPEVVPSPPALGGILIEAAPTQQADTADARETQILSASIPRRLLAAAVDGLIVLVALVEFSAIFLRFNPTPIPPVQSAGAAAGTAVLLWLIYQYLFVVYTGSTPGLRAACLEIARFDGSPATRRLRRWRVLAAFLSGLSAGVGYLWCVLDPDSLCWHDRITRTHLEKRG